VPTAEPGRLTTAPAPERTATPSAPGPALSPAATVLRLQRSAGNRAVAQLLGRSATVDPDLAGERVGRAIGSGSSALGDSARLHTDAAAQKLTQQLGVPALAVGSHVFATPGIPAEILGHELVHVEQARREPSVRVTLEPARRAAAEREARDPGDGPVREGGLVHYYGEAGHFYTAYLVALAVGFDDATAFKIAFYTQMPDEVSELDATHMAIASVGPVVTGVGERRAVRERDAVQRGGHALTGRPSAEERARRIAITSILDPDMPEFGLSVHALGDAYAHSAMGNEELMYQPVSGHLAQFPTGDPHAPDFISLRPVLYVTYVRALYRAMASAAQHWPQHHIVMLMKDERFVTDMAWEIGGLPEDQQIAAIRRLAAERLHRTMNAYSPENVPDRPHAEFARDPGPGAGASTPEARALAAGFPLVRAQGFDAWQASTIPAPVVPQSGPLNVSGFGYDAIQAAVGDAARRMRETRMQLEAEMRQFFQSQYGYGF
jgi:hypothetical protein